MSADTASMPTSTHVFLNLLTSRARAACKEATSDRRKSGPEEYYSIWLSRIRLEMVRLQSNLAVTN
jgi:hypothetical protein